MRCIQMLPVAEYGPWNAAFVPLMNIFCTVAWNFGDLFVIVLSLSLVERFRQLNRNLQAVENKNLPNVVWRQLRETYNSLADLTRTLDEAITKFVLLSFAGNLYFICIHLLQGMRLIMDAYHYVYFFYSFGILLLRSCTVLLCSSAIHDESKKPRRVLHAVPSESYCSEVRRFLAQVNTDHVALTGYNFFYVTRSLMLTMAGTIVTYEVLLIQFQGVRGSSSSPPAAKEFNITHAESYVIYS
ncbi:gustatory receptor for sugar taste 64f-like [Thrips palmi]|uniref:Gustatory receptor for sugar taste 64f-like n=1 Tax=Thrips palmi TaxID=161013 RepID=A0A6P8YY29_THRPL|nr:gustatory receptor for sugar taste 64f-like [Thrips palmi]